MRVLVSGASGLVGSALVPALAREGHAVVRAVRRAAVGEGEVRWDPPSGRIEGDPPFDAVVHLAGASLAAGRWNDALRRRAWESRVHATRALCEALERGPRPPRLVVAASATGFYGDRGEEPLDETSARGEGFLAELAEAWEGACEPASRAGARVVNLRIGLVLSRAGGALPRLVLPFRLGLGGPLGSGRQYWAWIALDDLVGVFRLALERADLRGPVNAVAPEPVTQRAFAATLGRVLRRPALLPAPAAVLRLALGGMADALLLASARVRPARLLAAGFRWRFSVLEDALRHALSRG